MELKMTQKRNKLIDKFVGNISTAILHGILDKAIDDEEISDKYRKEINVSLNRARVYRGKINPKDSILSDKDIGHIKTKIISKVKLELNQRILKEYENINLEIVESLVEKYLRNLKIIE